MARTKPLPCGHGSRHLSPYDGRCRRCVRDAKANKTDWPAPIVPATKEKRHEHDVAMQAVSNAA